MPKHSASSRPARHLLLPLVALTFALLLAACDNTESQPVPRRTAAPTTVATPPTDIPQPAALREGIAVTRLPVNADVIISSVRHVLADPACGTPQGTINPNFINDPACNRQIFAPDGSLLPLRQLYALDIETGNATQLTNLQCLFTVAHAINPTTLLAAAACEDTDASDLITDADQLHLYLINLAAGAVTCLTCRSGLEAINNPDYSHPRGTAVFSARDPLLGSQNHLYSIDLAGKLRQLTSNPDYMEFDPSWSEDGTTIVFSRLPAPWFSAPSQVWTSDLNGDALRQITEGALNPSNEPNHGPLPIGTDADPDLSPDGTHVVISRLRTGTQNQPFGIFDLVIANTQTGDEQLLDYTHANMRPEWKSEGILFVRQTAAAQPMDVTQALHLYRNSTVIPLEAFPYNVFPIGAFSGTWIHPD